MQHLRWGLICFECSASDVQNNAQKVSKRLRNRPRHPAQLAADVVERVIATGGEHYLETHQHKLTWWQLSLLDVKACLAVVVLLLACLVFLCCVAVMRRVGSRSVVLLLEAAKAKAKQHKRTVPL